MKGAFSTLKPDKDIFKELSGPKPPIWWKLLRHDEDLYIDIRKDNYINVYFLGGSIARIKYKNGFQIRVHQKYLGDNKPRGKTKKGNDKFGYDRLDLDTLDKAKVDSIKKIIRDKYSHLAKKEHPSEKSIQGDLITKNTKYIDSEFQFNQDFEIGKLRIDLIELVNGELTFVELKGITDSRLRNDKIKNSKVPEIIEQMERYGKFIDKYGTSLRDYYDKLLDIKRSIGLTVPDYTKLEINPTPRLLIKNTYSKETVGRTNRIHDIKELLDSNGIDYQIFK